MLLQEVSKPFGVSRVSKKKLSNHRVAAAGAAHTYRQEPAEASEGTLQDSKGSTGLVALAAFGVLHCILSPEAAAWGHTWRPRRHHRRLEEHGREPDLGKYAPELVEARMRSRAIAVSHQAEDPELEASSIVQQLSGLAENLKAKLLQQEQKAEEASSSLRARSVASSPYSTTRGFSPLITASLIVGAFLLARWLWSLLRMVQWSGGTQKQGKYIRDRGLGGKEVFIEDDASQPRLTGETGSPSPASFSGRSAPSDPWQSSQPKSEEVWTAPTWWSPPHSIYIDPDYKREAKQEAQNIINRMTNAKISGQDYDIASLVSIRQLCGETGVTIDAKTQRDPIFRAAADLAAASAEDGLNKLGGQSPGRFLSGLAQDLGIPEKEAVNMVNAVVAKRCRQSLITACACYRENENDDIMFQLLKLSGLMTALPLPVGSAQAEMVASGLQQRATLPERQAIFLTYGCMDQASAAVIAELMGFQPALVMPQLHKHILQGRRGYPAATPAG